MDLDLDFFVCVSAHVKKCVTGKQFFCRDVKTEGLRGNALLINVYILYPKTFIILSKTHILYRLGSDVDQAP